MAIPKRLCIFNTTAFDGLQNQMGLYLIISFNPKQLSNVIEVTTVYDTRNNQRCTRS